MKLFKHFAWVLLFSTLATSHLFAQEEFTPTRYWGLSAGINTYSIQNTFRILEGDIPIGSDYNLVDEYNRIAPTVGFEIFKERKENRFTNYNFRASYAEGQNELFTYRGGFVEKTAIYELQNGNDPFQSRTDFQPFKYFSLQGGIGFHRGVKNPGKWNFIYGFNFLGGYQFKKHVRFDNSSDKNVEVANHQGIMRIEFMMRLVRKFQNQMQFYVQTFPDLINISIASETDSAGNSSSGLDTNSNPHLIAFKIGFLSPLKK